MPAGFEQDDRQLVTLPVLDEQLRQFEDRLRNGEIQIPVPQSAPLNVAGGHNHYPNSDLNYSTAAATIQGTLPATAGDDNQEVWRHFRQKQGDNLTLDPDHALKAVDDSAYAAVEGASDEIPDWNRVDGWARIGGQAGADQYDVAVQLLSRLVGPGDTWYFLFRCEALDPALVPADVQFYVGIWEQRSGGGEGWITGGPFDLTSKIEGLPGATSTDYRILCKTDSGVSILSNVLTIADAPDVLSLSDYPKILYTPGRNAGFTEFVIYRKRGGVFRRLFIVKNTIDFQYNDTEEVPATSEVVDGWPADPGSAPRAFAQTRTLKVGSYGGAWQLNELQIRVPSAYDFSLCEDQFLRWGFTAPTAVDRHLGVDRLVFDTAFHEWSPDLLTAFADGSFPTPSTSPVSGNQGSGGGVFEPPDPGTGGGTCIVTSLPVMTRRRGKLAMVPYAETEVGDRVKGQFRTPYSILQKPTGHAAEFYRILTQDEIEYDCNALHELVLDSRRGEYVQARQVRAGMRLEGETISGQEFLTPVVKIDLIPTPAKVGTYVLRHPQGLTRDGHGIYTAGRSPQMDRGLRSSNVKDRDGLEL